MQGNGEALVFQLMGFWQMKTFLVRMEMNGVLQQVRFSDDGDCGE